MSAPARDLLIASPVRWDECCFSVPAVRALAGSGLGVGVLCEARQASFWQSIGGIEVITGPLDGDWKAALVWEDGAPAKAIAKAGIERRIGPAIGKLSKRLTHPLVDAPQTTEHRVRFYLNAAEQMGVETAKPEFFAPMSPSSSRSQASVLLCPDSDYGPSHEWLPERWQEVGQALVSHGHAPVIAALPNGRGIGAQLADAIGDKASLLNIDLAHAPLEALADFSHLIAADGSLPHLAAHAGATCITLFGPNDAQWKRPLGKRHKVTRHHVECAPCLLAKCPLDLRCQHELTSEHVLLAVESLLTPRN